MYICGFPVGDTVTIKDKKFTRLISGDQLRDGIKTMAEKINADLEGRRPIFLVVLNGAFMFAADLLREIRIPCEITFIRVSSYKGMSTTGQFRELIGLEEEVKDRDVVIIEDIVDSGKTLEHLISILKYKGAGAIKVASALFKRDAYTRSEPIDYYAFEIPNLFVVGYGMDYDGEGRNLKEIHILSSENGKNA